MTITPLGLLLMLAFLLAWPAAQAETPLYKDPAQPVSARVEDLLARMTLAEKVGQMTQINVTRLMGTGEWDRGPLNEAWLERILIGNGVGSLLSGGGAAPLPNTPRAWAEMTNALQRYATENSRLGIPLLYGTDAVHGHNNVGGATIFPHNLGLAASWQPELAQRVAQVTARDLRATGVHWNFAPVADLGRDPRWGRFYETFGEDPLLASSFVAASVRGLQGESLAQGGVAATVKHFVGYAQPLTGQDRSPAFVSPRSLHELHLPPFKAGIEEGAATAMANSGSLNHVPVHASPYLLTGLLRDGMGFEGVLVSDWNDILRLHTVHRTARSYDEAIERSITAGVDMYMVPHDAEGFTSRLTALVEAGRVPQARIDEAVRRILTLKFALGLFERPYVDAERADETVTGVASDRALAREAARASLTLLKNDGVLPLGEDVRAVLVTGPGADSVAEQMGGWTIGWQGLEGGREVPPAVTVFEGLRDGAPAGTEVRYLSAGAAGLREAAQEADVAVVVVGERPYAEGEGDSQSLSLPEAEEALIRELAATGTPTVVVLLAGRPLLLETLADVAALLMAYLPGSETGTAVADVVFGDYNPSGRLPFSWPRSTGQLPLSYDRLASEAPYDPRFAFGYGLSYTSYSYQNARATVSDEAVTVSVEVSNTGARAGHEVVQVFVEPTFGSVLAPVQRLAGFETVYLESGETATVSLELPLSRFAVLPGDVFDAPAAVVEASSYGLRIAESYVEVVLP